MDTNKIINELPKLFDKIAKDFEEWNMNLFKNEGKLEWRMKTFPQELKEYRNSFKYHIGRKYIRISCSKTGSYDQSFCFVNISHPKFEFGDILKSEVTTPALNFARGNIFDLDKSIIRWTGYIEKKK
jgi:hypothetical protein